MPKISKNIFLNSIVCLKLGWLMLRRQVTQEPTLGEKFRIEEGKEIGVRARTLFSNGVLVDERNLISSLETTQTLINDQNISEIFEGTFSSGNYVTKADILRKKSGNDCHIIEVKSSVNNKAKFIDDMAYTTMVITHSGFNISKISIMLMSRDFRLGMPNKDLFVEIDHTNEVLTRVAELEVLMDEVDRITGSEDTPECELCFECKKCSLFKSCQGDKVENHIFDIPRLSKPKFDRLKGSDIICIEDIPEHFPLTANQKRVKDSVQSGRPYVSSSLRTKLYEISWPAFFFDFETVKTALPLYPNIAPHVQILTQYSIHKCSEFGNVVDHLEYLADPSRDCRRELAESLIENLEEEGSIVVYSTFEKTMLNKLKVLFIDLSQELDLIIERLVDLHKIIRDNYYHPDFHGSTSNKKVLPVLVPDLSYSGLEIAEGDSAMAAFANMALGRYNVIEVNSIQNHLLKYCKKDTEAEVKVFEKLVTEYC